MIEAKARDMLRHYVDAVMPNGFKAQVVATSRLATVRYREAFLRARDELVAEIENARSSAHDSRGHRPGWRAADKTARLVRASAHLALIRALDFVPVISGSHNDDSGLAAVVRWRQAQDQHRCLQAAARGRIRRSNLDAYLRLRS